MLYIHMYISYRNYLFLMCITAQRAATKCHCYAQTYSIQIPYQVRRDLHADLKTSRNMMTSSNGNTFRVTGPLCGEFTLHVFFDLRMNKRLSK